MIVALLVATLLLQIAHFVFARLEARRMVHAALARTPAEFEAFQSGQSGTL